MSRNLGWALGLVASLLAVAAPARAQDAPSGPGDAVVADASPGSDDARTVKQRGLDLFNAAAAAYAARNFPAAIQALEAAYKISPRPLLLYNIAQAERRQYFLDRRLERLARSVALFHRYLEEVPSGGRSADAIEALAQLEPLLAQTQTTLAPPGSADRGTRILVLCEVPNARISVDGTEPGVSPLIREVTPGKHQLQVRAPGYRDGLRQIDAVKGELVPATVTLAELPSRLLLSTPEDAEIYVDGVLVSQGASELELELPSGRHRVSVAQKGHYVATKTLELQRGQASSASFQLEPTRQRFASHMAFVGSGVAFAAGGAFGYMALMYESSAQDFLKTHQHKPATPGELIHYNDDVKRRNFYRMLAGGSLVVSFGLLVTGLFLHELDTPSIEDISRAPPAQPPLQEQPPLAATRDPARKRFDLGAFFAPGEFGASLRGEF